MLSQSNDDNSHDSFVLEVQEVAVAVRSSGRSEEQSEVDGRRIILVVRLHGPMCNLLHLGFLLLAWILLARPGRYGELGTQLMRAGHEMKC